MSRNTIAIIITITAKYREQNFCTLSSLKRPPNEKIRKGYGKSRLLSLFHHHLHQQHRCRSNLYLDPDLEVDPASLVVPNSLLTALVKLLPDASTDMISSASGTSIFCCVFL